MIYIFFKKQFVPLLICSTLAMQAMAIEEPDVLIPLPPKNKLKSTPEKIPSNVKSDTKLKVGKINKEAEALRKENEQLKQALATKVQAQASAPKAATSTSTKPEAISYSQHADILKVNNCQVCNELVKLPAGSFQMGSENGASDEKPVHKVTVAAFEISRTEVTQAQWQAVMGKNPSWFKENGAKRPVERVSWDDIQEFLSKLNKNNQGYTYRLPTEAEWEYAARAGGQGKWSFGDDESKLGEYAWYEENSQNSTQEVASKKPNEWGLYDIHGNVWESVQDCYEADYRNGQPTNGAAHRANDNTCQYRVVRGGSWYYIPYDLRAANRSGDTPANRGNGVGFRLARTVP